jgi:hypothetical protein
MRAVYSSQPAALIDDGSSDGKILSVLPLHGGRAIYLQRRTCCSGPPPSWHIWNATTNGSLAPFELTVASSARIWNGEVWSFEIGPTGDILYLADEEHDDVRELFLTLGPRAHVSPRRSGPP